VSQSMGESSIAVDKDVEVLMYDEPELGRAPVGKAHEPTTRSHWVVSGILAVGLVIVIFPFIWMLLGSFKTEGELRQVPPTVFPEAPTVENYQNLWSQLNVPQFAFNSAIVALAVTVGNLLFCSMAGYALAKLGFPGKRAVMVVVLAMLMVPGTVTFVPLFVLTSNMGLVNTYGGLIIPFLAGAFGVFLMRQFMENLPNELIEAARIDGANEFTIFFRIMLPLARPALATLALLTFLGNWNSFLWPLVVAQSENMYTLPIALALYSTGQYASQYALLMAGAVVVIIPVLILFIFLQRFFVQGAATTGIK